MLHALRKGTKALRLLQIIETKKGRFSQSTLSSFQ